MPRKNNIRSIRFTDEMADLIDRQVGNTFTEKFENLVTRCVWEMPGRETELEKLERKISQRKEELEKLTIQAKKLTQMLKSVQYQMDELYRTLLIANNEVKKEL